MSNYTEREITNQFESIINESAISDTPTPAVEWRESDPKNRPNGIDWNPDQSTLVYDTWEAQRRAIDATTQEETDIAAFLAGYGSGKTLLGARWLIKQALQYDSSRFLCLGIDFQKARDTTFRVLFEQLPGERTGIVTSSYTGPEESPIIADYNRQDHRLTFTNDTVIKLGSADRWNRYAGDSYGGVWADEVGHYSDLHDLLEMLGSRLRGVSGPKTQLWTLTGNGKNDAFDIIERGEDSNGEELGLNIETVKASTLNNPYLSESEKERFKRQYGNTSREGQALHGGFASSGGNLLTREQLSFVDKQELSDRQLRFHIGVDLSYVSSKSKAQSTDSDYTAAVLLGYDQANGSAYLIDMKRERGMTLQESVNWLSNIASQVPEPTVKIEDVAAQTYFIQEAQRSVPGNIQSVTPGNNSKEERITDMSVLFERGDVKLINHSVDADLGYDPRHRPFIREWLEFGASGSSPDLLDAAYYALQDIALGDSGSVGSIYSGEFYSRT